MTASSPDPQDRTRGDQLVECFGAGASPGKWPDGRPRGSRAARSSAARGYYPEAACRPVLCGLRIGRGAQAVECGHQDWFGVAGVAVDRGDGNDHVEDLFEGELVPDFAGVLCGGEERPGR